MTVVTQRIAILLMALSAVACLHSEQLDHYPTDVISCRTNDDCSGEKEMHCGGVVSDGAGCIGQGFVNTETGDVSTSAPDEPNAFFMCIDRRRYFPFCTPKSEVVCDGTICSPLNPHGCAKLLDGPTAGPFAQCVLIGDLQGTFDLNNNCVAGTCIGSRSCVAPLIVPNRKSVITTIGCVQDGAIH